MPRAGLSSDAAVAMALDVVDGEGPAALTLAAVAVRAGVATPSLNKHVASLAGLRSLVSRRVLEELTERITAAVLGRSGDEAVRALLLAYRSYVVQHPNRCRPAPQPVQRHVPVPAPPFRPHAAPVADRLLGVLLAVLAGFGLQGSEAIHMAPCLRSAVHGFAVLEAAGGFGLPEDLDASYDLLVHLLIAGLHTPDSGPHLTTRAPSSAKPSG